VAVHMIQLWAYGHVAGHAPLRGHAGPAARRARAAVWPGAGLAGCRGVGARVCQPYPCWVWCSRMAWAGAERCARRHIACGASAARYPAHARMALGCCALGAHRVLWARWLGWCCGGAQTTFSIQDCQHCVLRMKWMTECLRGAALFRLRALSRPDGTVTSMLVSGRGILPFLAGLLPLTSAFGSAVAVAASL
jgi:hypothetical protein